MIEKTCLFLHGLESGPNGRKAVYLKKICTQVLTPDLQTGLLSFKTNSFMMSAIRNAPSIFFGNYAGKVTRDILQGSADIVQSTAVENKPDFIVASSMGGAIALECLKTGILRAPTILMAPALGRLLFEESLSQWCEDFKLKQGDECGKNIIVVHGALDNVIDVNFSRELCAQIGAELIEVKDGDHSLNDYLLDGNKRMDGSPQGDNLLSIVRSLIKKCCHD